jgi:photosystem II stability/assembly factor-like uncharacterized protein
MKNFTLFFIAFLLLKLSVLAQQGWFWQNPLPQGNTLNDVWTIDDSTAIAVGNRGTILKTTDNGNSWDIKSYNITSDLNCVYFVDNIRGWIGGDDESVLQTTNGGETWDILSNNPMSGYNCYSLCFQDANTGWALFNPEASGSLYHIKITTNGGSDWFVRYSSVVPKYNICKSRGSHSNLWVVGDDGFVLKSTDGGEIWEEVSINFYPFALHSVYFINNDVGWVGGGADFYDHSGTAWLYKTTNGGLDWLEQFFDNSSYHKTKSIYFINENTGWISTDNLRPTGGDHGMIFKTIDGGENWEHQYIFEGRVLNSINFHNENVGWSVGALGEILSTANGGNEWNSLLQGYRSCLTSVYFTDENTGWAIGDAFSPCGPDIILKTTNGGEDWFSQYIANYPIFTLFSAHFVDSNTGWVVGLDAILKTTNGGEDWIEQNGGQGEFNVDVFFIDNNTGWVATGSDSIYKTTNGGEDWMSQSTGTDARLNAVHFIDNNLGWTVGSHSSSYQGGYVFETTNGGEDWNTIISNEYRYTDVFFVDNMNGWIVGYKGYNVGDETVVYKTTNSGQDWLQYIFDEILYFDNIFFIDENNGWALEKEHFLTAGTIYRTTNGGEDWIRGTEIGSSLYFVNENIGWLVRGNGILKTTNGGVSYIEESKIDEIPTNFYLSYNYPNPFNPNTKIRYSIPQTSNVVIKVFDILGNEIETLVNEEKQTGTYEITWLAEGLPSGVYFYRLQAGDFVETKKMILLK